MSTADKDILKALQDHHPLMQQVGKRISSDRIEQGAAMPFVVYSRTDTQFTRSLDGSIVEALIVYGVQCVADRRSEANATADNVTEALEAAQITVTGRSNEYVPEIDAEMTTIICELWED